jgi:hypothetical protein
MSVLHHTDISPGSPASAATFNAPLGELDQAIQDILSGSSSLSTLYAALAHSHSASAITSDMLNNARVSWAAPGAIGTTTPAAGKFTDLEIDGALNHDGSTAGFYNTTPVVKPTVSGSRQGNPAVASLLSALAGQGLVTDSTTAAGASARLPLPLRLSLSATLPVSSADILAATTLYCHPYGGNEVELYTGSAWETLVMSSVLSIAVPVTTNTNYDVFIYNNSGTLTLELTAWANDLGRASTLVWQNGIRLKNGALTRRYVGTIRTDGMGGQCEDSAKRRFVFNAYNKTFRTLRYAVYLDGHTYVGGWRPWNNNTAVRAEIVLGEASDLPIFSSAYIYASAGLQSQLGLGVDSTTVSTGNSQIVSATAGSTLGVQAGVPNFLTLVAGYHYLQVLQAASGGACTFYNGAVDAMVMI